MSLFVKAWLRLPERVRRPLIRLLQRSNRGLYRTLLFRWIDLKDGSTSLPPAELRYRVSGVPDVETFIQIGARCAEDIREALAQAGYDLRSFERILDFGCGCGRVLIPLSKLTDSARLYGTDVDRKAIEWCHAHLRFAEFAMGADDPPTGYGAETFDLIYAISVFTHLDEDYQFRWLAELRRITRTGGIVLITLHEAPAGRPGFVVEDTYEKGLFPAWYKNAYHSEEYVRANFSAYFAVLSYIRQGMNNHQNVLLLRKHDGQGRASAG